MSFDKSSASTLSLACRWRNIQIIKAVYEAGAKADAHTFTTALKTRDIAIIELPFIWRAPNDEDSLYELLLTINAWWDKNRHIPSQGYFDLIINAKECGLREVKAALVSGCRASGTLDILLEKVKLTPENIEGLSKILNEESHSIRRVKVLLAKGAKPTAEVWQHVDLNSKDYQEPLEALLAAGAPLIPKVLLAAIKVSSVKIAQDYLDGGGEVTKEHKAIAKWRASQLKHSNLSDSACQIKRLVSDALKQKKKPEKTSKK